MKQVSKYIKKIFLFISVIIVSVGILMPASAKAEESEEKIVRVGWYESAFHHTDEFGRRSGYGYEYQQHVATFTNWKFEYVEGSWSQLLEKLMAGEIDLLSDVSYTPERAEKILYSSLEMGSEDYHAFISPDNTEIRPDDFSTFNNKKVGVNKNSIQEKLFVEWAETYGLNPEIIELTVKTPEMLKMLEDGEIDVLVTLDTYGNSEDIIPVCKIGSAVSYFGINKDRPDLKNDLDVAMNRLLENNRDFNQQLTEKYNKASSVNSFLTPEEKEWVSDHQTIRIGYRNDFLPYCDYDETKGVLTGALSDYLQFASSCQKNAELHFVSEPFDTTEAALQALINGDIDCMFPINLSTYDGEQMGLIISDPFVSTEMYVAVRTKDHQGVSADTEMKVAVLKGHPNHETFLKDNFPKWEIQYNDTSLQNFEAVRKGEADCTLISSYRINRVSNLTNSYNLSTLATGETMDLSFAMNHQDDQLLSITNKVLKLYSDTVKTSSLTKYSFRDDRVTLIDYLRDNFIYALIFTAVVTASIVLLVIRGTRAEAKASEGRQLISETERDPLTGLFNWNFFLAYANRLYREDPDTHRDAIVINVDRFHSINALHGREFGDLLLRRIGQEISKYLEQNKGIACRFEADRFDIYCKQKENYDDLSRLLHDAVGQLSQNANIHLRIGVKPWQKDEDPLMQFDRARTACNMLRGDYKTQIMVYDATMGKKEERDQLLINDFRKAIEEGQFKIWYQPKYDIQAEPPVLASCEALVRWDHPSLGIIPPGDFVPLLEDNGEITILDRFVWQEAARQISAWYKKYGYKLSVSVNLSRVDVFDPELFDILDDLIINNDLKYQDLKLEVTESAYTENAAYLIQVIEKLRQKGFQIEMDDFGSGYSSLNMLSSMPVDILKMDMAFVQNIERNEQDLHLVEMILDIARYLNVLVVAEGVENANQLALLKNAGCHIVQGFYFSTALPPEDFEEKILKPVLEKQ